MKVRLIAALFGLGLLALPARADTDLAFAPPIADPKPPVYLLAEAGTGQALAAERPDLRFVPASMTKVMTAYVAFELLAQGKLRADQHIIVRPETAAYWSGRGTSLELKAGESLTVDDLLRGIATVSANDAAVILAEGAAGSVQGWTALMNAEARHLGMKDSHFNTPNGWPDNGATYVSARDLVTLGSALIERHPDLYRRYFGQRSMTWNGKTRQNHDPITGVVAGADGIKTGFTREAGFNFVGSAERNGRRLVMVVAGARNEADRARAAIALMEWGFSAWRSRQLFAAGASVGEARVQGGASRWVDLVTSRPIPVAIPQPAERSRLTGRIVYHGPLAAPIAKGSEVALLEVTLHGKGRPMSFTVPLAAAETVEEAGPLDRLWNGLMGLFS